jgi:hypothetical protein
VDERDATVVVNGLEGKTMWGPSRKRQAQQTSGEGRNGGKRETTHNKDNNQQDRNSNVDFAMIE